VKTRRAFLTGSLAAAAMAAGRAAAADLGAAVLGLSELPEGTLEASRLEALPGKLPLIRRTARPPNYETPLEFFDQPLTPNRAFFVRYHLGVIPQVDPRTWRLNIEGGAKPPLDLSLEDLQRTFPQHEVVAVCQCSGNRRGLFEPHVAGVQWGVGAMGNARWTGVRLRDLLERAGLRPDAVEVVFEGADGAVFAQTPDFVKSLPLDRALADSTLVAWGMNGEPLPHWNGHPARLVVPGWTATYWMKHLTAIRVLPQPFDGFWMKSAYRIPQGRFPEALRFASQETEANLPITNMVVNSLLTNVRSGMRLPVDSPFTLQGLAWDGGSGIAEVQVTVDDGMTWQRARLGEDLGPYAFRPFTHEFRPSRRGTTVVSACATNRAGQRQRFELVQNPAGYHHNVVQAIPVVVV
jgi:DMSO/TMAO reductase YedYZ molybdopterin-dependent catalytic subunit